MNPEHFGLIGAVVGSAVGVLGGILGTYFGIKNTGGPRERAFVVRASAAGWLLVIAFVAGMWLIPHPQRPWLWPAYAVLLLLGVFAWNRRQFQIRQKESGHRAQPNAEAGSKDPLGGILPPSGRLGSALCVETTMRRILTVLLTLVAILFAVALAGVLLPAVNKVQDLGESGAGLELGEWQVSVGGCLLGSVLFTVLALSSRKTRFPTGFLTVSCLALLGFGAVALCLYSIKGRTGVVNQYGHGLTYGEWWASIIPWTIAAALTALAAVSSLIYALKKHGDA